MGEHASAEELRVKLSEANNLISIGSKWVHFKNPTHYYEITDLVITEEDDSVAVIYRSTFEPTEGISFFRPIDSFLSKKILEDGTEVDRFSRVE